MKTFFKVFSIALAVTSITSIAKAMTCQIGHDQGESYIFVQTSNGNFRAPKASEMEMMMSRNPELFTTMSNAVSTDRMHSFLTDSTRPDNQWVNFWFKSQPSRTSPGAHCKDKSISGHECFDRMIKNDPRFHVAAGMDAPYWMFASRDEDLYPIMDKMGCKDGFRREAQASAAPAATSPQAARAQAAATSPRGQGAPAVVRPATPAAPTAQSISVMRPGANGRREAMMTLEAPAAASTTRAASSN